MTDAPVPLDHDRRVALLRDYAGGAVSWRELQELGFVDYIEVLGGLGALGLRPPTNVPDGPNAAARERGRALLRRLLAPPSSAEPADDR